MDDFNINDPKLNVKLVSLGIDFGEASAEWVISICNEKFFVTEFIKFDPIGIMYYDLLFEAFIK